MTKSPARAVGIVVIALLAVLCLSRIALGQSGDFEALRSRLTKLRNNDIHAEKVHDWLRLADDLEAFANRNKKSGDASTALFQAGVLYETLGRERNDERYSRSALELLERVEQEYPQSAISDESLLKRGDILKLQLNNQRAAREAYRAVIRRYPATDSAQAAQLKLEKIEQGHSRAVPEERELEPPSPEAVSARRGEVRIVVDPGHGGEDLGAVGQGGLLEKDVTLAIAFELEALLKRELGAEVRLTRRSDVFVPLAARTERANEFNADIFISVHTNASPEKRLSGLEVYYLDNTGDEASRKLAERENSVGNEDVSDLDFILSDLIQSAKLDDSIRLAHALNNHIPSEMARSGLPLRARGVLKAPFFVLVGAHMPCVLVETAFIDHVEEGKRLGDPSYRSKLARGILAGVRDFLEGSRQGGGKSGGGQPRKTTGEGVRAARVPGRAS